MAYEVNSRGWRFRVELGSDGFKVCQIDEAPVTVIWGEVVVGEKVGPDNGLFNVSDCKIEWKYLVAQGNRMSNASKASNVCAISC